MAEEFGSFDSLIDDDFFFDFDPSILIDSPPAEDFVLSSPDSWIGEIESKLMSDENQEEREESFVELDQGSVSDFIADLLVDYPISDPVNVDLATELVTTGKETDGSDVSGKENTDLLVEKNSNDSGSEIQDDEAKVESEIEENDDAVAKKRRRYT